MYTKRIILALIALILIGGILTAVYRALGGVPGEVQNELSFIIHQGVIFSIGSGLCPKVTAAIPVGAAHRTAF